MRLSFLVVYRHFHSQRSYERLDSARSYRTSLHTSREQGLIQTRRSRRLPALALVMSVALVSLAPTPTQNWRDEGRTCYLFNPPAELRLLVDAIRLPSTSSRGRGRCRVARGGGQ